MAETIEELRGKGLVYQGRLRSPRATTTTNGRTASRRCSSRPTFGDDVDRALMKSDGSYTYFAADMAYHHNKLQRGFKHLINVFGADHAGYITRVQGGGQRRCPTARLDLDIKVVPDGQAAPRRRAGASMSKRAGTFVTLRDVVDEVGRDPVRFMMLYRKNDAPLDFDFAKVVEQSKDNPVFYVQYAHARAHSVFRKAAEAFPQSRRRAAGGA